MTQPEPTPGAPAFIQPAPTVPASAPTAPQTTDPSDQAFDGEFDSDRAAKLIENLRKDLANEKSKRVSSASAAAEQSKKELAQQVAKALGLAVEGEELDPAKLNDHLEQAQAAAWRSGVELSVLRVASRLGADPDSLLDSNSFLDTLDDLVDDDPRSPDFAAALEAKVQEALQKYPNKYRANGQAPAAPTAPRPDPSQGSRSGAPTPAGRTLTDAIRAHYNPGR